MTIERHSFHSRHTATSQLGKAEITSSPGGFDLVIRGGDAATGYTATLRFSTSNRKKAPVLISRMVRSSENPDERNDHFEYRFVSPDADY